MIRIIAIAFLFVFGFASEPRASDIISGGSGVETLGSGPDSDPLSGPDFSDQMGRASHPSNAGHVSYGGGTLHSSSVGPVSSSSGSSSGHVDSGGHDHGTYQVGLNHAKSDAGHR